ncbi:hypothetical protein DFP94_10990 [Fontibacillus phaseoli]|uniref:DUF4064 domain-containing protein n=1 Tax=Fontibacillus phaseoli TaxID=1416533 RepID=A0A369B9X8_9BACL|nr:hypothetical protein [Fontibacillus phaseoli]RCX17366.1 hypothetical protein DFP94_10990 [Fontibacillus phaseoli]
MDQYEQNNLNGTPVPVPPYPEYGALAASARKHSGPGIASFVVILVAIVVYIFSLTLVTAAVIDIADQSIDAITEDMMIHSGAIIGILMMMLAGVLHLVALILSIIGLVLKNRKKLFAILGLSFSVGIFILLMILFALGSI